MGNGQGITLTRFISPYGDTFDSDEKRYLWQMDIRANYILIDDVDAHILVDTHIIKQGIDILQSDIKWLNRGELIAGSFMCNVVEYAEPIEYNDIDIYFKSKADVIEFLSLNKDIWGLDDINSCKVALKMTRGRQELNLIFGVEYESPKDLITRFDIRASSIAYDPTSNKIFCVRGAFDDCRRRRIVYNPVPHNTTVARLVKYIKKDFHIDPYQRLFFAELIKSDQYNPELELSTGYRSVLREDL